jgi:hypothetical protein
MRANAPGLSSRARDLWPSYAISARYLQRLVLSHPADIDIGASNVQDGVTDLALRTANNIGEGYCCHFEHLLVVSVRQAEHRFEDTFILDVALVDEACFTRLARWSPLYNIRM